MDYKLWRRGTGKDSWYKQEVVAYGSKECCLKELWAKLDEPDNCEYAYAIAGCDRAGGDIKEWFRITKATNPNESSW